MTAQKSSRVRRTQVERTTETRAALIEAAITVLHRDGYNGATTAAIADEAGVSRGSIIYQFGTRAQLMSDVVAFVYEQESAHYRELEERGFRLNRPEDWPEALWTVYSQPSGMAVIEILQASRSDPELAGLVSKTQADIEFTAQERMLERFEAVEAKHVLATMRLFVWAMRGLALGNVLGQVGDDVQPVLRTFRYMARKAFGSVPSTTPEANAIEQGLIENSPLRTDRVKRSR